MKSGIELIAIERARQKTGEGWTAEHDASHTGGELAIAAICYAAPEPIFTKSERRGGGVYFDDPFPWNSEYDKRKWDTKSDDAPIANEELPTTQRIRNLVKAGALIAAEIDRLQGQGRRRS